MNSPIHESRKDRPVTAALNALTTATDALHKRIDILDDDLSPVMEACPHIEAAAPDEVTSATCAMEAQILRVESAVLRACHRLGRMAESLRL